MDNVVPLHRKMHVLFVEDDWVIRQILLEHFAQCGNGQAVQFPDADRALAYLHQACGADRIFSNIEVGPRGGIELSDAGPDRQNRFVLAIAPGYDAEHERFRAIEAGRGFFRVKPYAYRDLWQVLRHARFQTSYR